MKVQTRQKSICGGTIHVMCTFALWPTQTSQSQKTATNWQHTPGWYFSPTHDTSRHIFHTDPSPRHFIYPYRVLAGGRHSKPYWRLPGDVSSFKPPWLQTFLLVLRSGRRSSWSRVIKKFTIKQEIRQPAGVQYSNTIFTESHYFPWPDTNRTARLFGKLSKSCNETLLSFNLLLHYIYITLEFSSGSHISAKAPSLSRTTYVALLCDELPGSIVLKRPVVYCGKDITYIIQNNKTNLRWLRCEFCIKVNLYSLINTSDYIYKVIDLNSVFKPKTICHPYAMTISPLSWTKQLAESVLFQMTSLMYYSSNACA